MNNPVLQTIGGGGFSGIPEFRVEAAARDGLGLCSLALPGLEQKSTATLAVDLRNHTQEVMYRLAESSRLYELQTTLVTLGCLRPGDLAIDIGAHVGYFTLLFRLAVGATGRVLAFEPSPETYRCLLQNVMANEFTNVQPLPLAVAERSGTANFYVNSSNEGESSLFGLVGQEKCPVQVTSLDEIFALNLSLRPRVLKIDAEGAELNILNGARAWFERQGPDLAIVEINRGALQAGGATEWDIQRFFDRMGYRGAVIGGNPELGVGAGLFRCLGPDYQGVPADCEYVFNLMFVREGSGIYGVEYR